jgi:hypothetical protein
MGSRSMTVRSTREAVVAPVLLGPWASCPQGRCNLSRCGRDARASIHGERTQGYDGMTVPALHIVFNMSAAGDLRKALTQAGRTDEVIALCDDLSFGPINPPEASLRTRWVETELGYDWAEVGNKADTFWDSAFSGQRHRIVWTSRRSNQEYVGFLEFVWRLDDIPCEFIDLTEVTLTRRDPKGKSHAPALVGSLALIPADDIAENKLWDLAQNLTAEMRDAYRAKWANLRTENAALRVLDAALELVSAPISFFDQHLLSRTERRWLKAARIVAEVMASFWRDSRRQVGDLILASRLGVLVDSGLLEGKGDLSQIRFSEVRLPPQAPDKASD